MMWKNGKKPLTLAIAVCLTMILSQPTGWSAEKSKPRISPTPEVSASAPQAITPVSQLQETGDTKPTVVQPANLTPVHTLETPAVNTEPAPSSVENTPASELIPVSLNTETHAPVKQELPPKYLPAQAIAIFPVLRNGPNKAFGDLPLVLSKEFALRLEDKAPETKIHHPIYTVEEFKMRGLDHVYHKIMNYYLKADRPDPANMAYLLGQLNMDGKPVSRVIFVEADLDTNRPLDPHMLEVGGIVDKVHEWLNDTPPKHMKYTLRSRVQVFDAESPGMPMVWAFNWRKTIKANSLGNVTASVYQDSDSHRVFSNACRAISREVSWIMPSNAYMQPNPFYETGVRGHLISQEASITESGTIEASHHPSSVENRSVLQRILKRNSY